MCQNSTKCNVFVIVLDIYYNYNKIIKLDSYSGGIMAQNQTKEELNNGKIDKNSVIVEAGEKNEVLDFLDYLETSNHPSAIKIRNLRQYLSDEELLTAYYNNIGSGETKEGLESALEGFFVSLATHITELPNGVVIDLNTGLVDIDKSFEQALKVGIYSKDSVIVEKDIHTTDLLRELDLLKFSYDEEKVKYIVENLKFDFLPTEDFYKRMEEFWSIDENELNLSEELKKQKKEDELLIKSSKYKDPLLYEISKLHVDLENAKNTENYNVTLRKIRDFYEKHPEYEEIKLPIKNSDGSINENERNEINEFTNACIRTDYYKIYHDINTLIKNGVDISKGNYREKILFPAFAGLKYRTDENPVSRAISKEAEKIILQLFPEVDLNNEKELAAFFVKEIGFKGNIDKLSLTELIDVAYISMQTATEERIKKAEINKDFEIDSLDMDSRKKTLYKNDMENYFSQSKIVFSKKDEVRYDELYKSITVDSWIESKEEAIRLRHMALSSIRDEYLKKPLGEYTTNKLKEINDEIQEIESKYGDIDFSPKEDEYSFDAYREEFLAANLVIYLARDASSWNNGTNYEGLEVEDKKKYIINTLHALKHRDNPDFHLTKIAIRRLEMMNSEGKTFVEVDENGEFKINEELLVEEYQKYSEFKYENFNELMKSARLKENEFLQDKLREYSELDESAFVKLEDKNDYDKSMEQIENARYLSNQKRIHKIGKNFNIKNDKDIINKSVYESDMHMFEICKLHRELRDPKNVEHTQMYSIKLAEIKKFYEKYPQYRDMKLPILNEDGTLNDEEIMKMDQFSEAYQRIIIFEHLDEFYISKANSIDELPKKDREHILLCVFAGLKYEKSDDQDLRNLAKRCSDVIKKSYPELDVNDEKKLADFFKEKIGFSGLVEKISIDDVIEITNQELKEATENYIEKDQNSYVDKDIDFTALDLDSGRRKIYSSVMKNYFVGSKLNFLEKEEKKYNEFYNHVTVDSWIENKEDALKLRYMALNEIKNEYIQNPVGTYTENKLKDIEKDIKEFEAEYGKFDLDSLKNEISFSKYKKQFVYAGMTKYLTRDASDWSDGINYSDLDEGHKKGYIRNILVALDNNGKDTYLTKIALRRLELMNTDKNKFVEIYDNNKYKINKELILKEYKGMSDYEYSNFDELKQSVKLRENEYILDKLKEYTKIHENDFQKLDNKKDYKASMKQIEKARYVSNQKKIQAMIDEWKKKDREEPDVEQTSLDKLLEENVQKGAVKKEDLNVATERTEYTEKSSNQEEASIDREEAQGEQTNTGMVLENIDDSATKKTETKTLIIEGKQITLSEKVKQAVKTVKDFLKKHLSIKNKQERLGSGEEKGSSTGETTSSSVTGKVQNNSFIQTVVVDTKAAIQESQNLSQTDLQKESQAKSDDEMEIG